MVYNWKLSNKSLYSCSHINRVMNSLSHDLEHMHINYTWSCRLLTKWCEMNLQLVVSCTSYLISELNSSLVASITGELDVVNPNIWLFVSHGLRSILFSGSDIFTHEAINPYYDFNKMNWTTSYPLLPYSSYLQIIHQ